MSRHSLRRHQHWVLCLAILAVLMNALAPGISQALQAGVAQRDDSWVEACSVDGARWIKLDATGQVVAQASSRPAELPADVHEASCGYCLPHAGTFALLDSVSAEVLRAQALDVGPPSPDIGIVAAALAWERPGSRAPPRA